MCREGRSAQANHPRRPDSLQELGGVVWVAYARERRVPFVHAVVFDDDRGDAPPARDDARLDALDFSGNARMYGRADKAIRLADLLANQHARTWLYQRFAGRAGMLQKRHGGQGGRRRVFNRLCPAGTLFAISLVRMHAAAKGHCLAQCFFPQFLRVRRAI